MTIGIIGAMDEEIAPLLSKIHIEKKEKRAAMEFNCGKFKENDIVIVRCGIGKVNAAVCTQILVDDFNVDYVINVGIAGGIGENVYPGDVVIAENLVEHDMDVTALGERAGQIPGMNVYDFVCDPKLVKLAVIACKKFTERNHFTGRIVSGDQFIAGVEKIKWLSSEFGALACEMEGASIAHVCCLNSVPFVVIRSISDNANNGAHIDYEKFKPIAVKNSTVILENMLEML